MNGVIAAHETPFEEVRDDLLTEYQQEAAGRAIAGRREQIDDLLAAGATLEDLAGEAGMEIATVDYAPGLDSDIAGYEAFRTAADKLQKDDFPETILLNDGGLLAMRLDEVVAPKLKPFEEVRDDVAEAARKDALTKALAARATEIAKAAEEGTDLGSFGPVEDLGPMTRDGFVEGVPETLVPAAFEMQQGAFRAIEGSLLEALALLRHHAQTLGRFLFQPLLHLLPHGLAHQRIEIQPVARAGPGAGDEERFRSVSRSSTST